MKNKKGLIIIVFLLFCIVCAWYMTNFAFPDTMPEAYPVETVKPEDSQSAEQPAQEPQQGGQENSQEQAGKESNSEAEPAGQEAAADKPDADPQVSSSDYVDYYFRNSKLLNQHYDKHGKEMGFADAKAYEKAASDVVNNPDALYKIEKEDGDEVYYVEATNEFVVVSTDGYLRTYFLPDSGKKYFDKQ